MKNRVATYQTYHIKSFVYIDMLVGLCVCLPVCLFVCVWVFVWVSVSVCAKDLLHVKTFLIIWNC